MITKTCEFCGHDFQARRRSQRFCSRGCALQMNSPQGRAWIALAELRLEWLASLPTFDGLDLPEFDPETLTEFDPETAPPCRG